MCLWSAQTVDAFGNLPYEAVCIVHKSKLELEKEAGESKAHKSIRTPSRAERHMMCGSVLDFAYLLVSCCAQISANTKVYLCSQDLAQYSVSIHPAPTVGAFYGRVWIELCSLLSDVLVLGLSEEIFPPPLSIPRPSQYPSGPQSLEFLRWLQPLSALM